MTQGVKELALFFRHSVLLLFLIGFSFKADTAAGEVTGDFVCHSKDTREIWSLEESIRCALAVSPEILSRAADVSALEGDFQQAGAWPNPEVEVGGDSKLGREDNSGGVDLTQVAVSQAIPMGRLGRQRKVAQAKYRAAEKNLFFQQLVQEAETARRFHDLQLMEGKLALSEEQLVFADRYHNKDQAHQALQGDPVVRYLNPLEQKRLAIMWAVAKQAVATAEGEYSEADAGFKLLLKLPDGEPHKLADLEPVVWHESLENLLTQQEQSHPALQAAKLEEDAALAGIRLARGERLPEPSLRVFGERDFLDGKRDNFYGASIHLRLPLWDRKKGLVSKAKSESKKANYDYESIKRELQERLKQNYLHLGHLMEQVNDYHAEILEPAREVFELTQNAFASGEVNVLSLIDANVTYFDARRHYLELLHETWLELAELRLAAGISMMGDLVLDRGQSPEVRS